MTSKGQPGLEFVSIVVADSTRIHTQLLSDAMNKDEGLQVVATASTSADLVAAVLRVPIDVVVLSHNLDNQPGHGTQVLREMRKLRPQIKGVILLDSSEPEVVLDCFRAGARGIFSKQERLETLCKCIRAVHEGQIWARSIELDHALEALANSPRVHATNHKGIELLSAREREVIQNVAGGMTNREIAKALHLSPHTIKNYLFRIFDKLGVSSRTELLYLTMNNSQIGNSANGDGHALVDTIRAAESGDPAAQLRLADYYKANNGPQDLVAAYMWYLLASKTAAPLFAQIEEGKSNIRHTMSPQQIEEAEARVAEWLKNSRKQSAFETRASSHKKMHVGAD
ncbi:MAG: LuxR C-terminal-related transcriptional regulator [Terriglobales bacterium]